MQKPIVTALTSYGMSGAVFHAPVISAHKGFHLKYILERSKNLSKERYPDSTIARNYDEILKDPSIELVIVNTPNALHFPMSKEALLAGKHVVVEKPFSVTVKDGEELIKLAKEKNLFISAFHNKRFEGEFKTVQKLVQEKQLGELELFETHFDRYRPEISPKKWKEDVNPGAGLLYDLGPHMIDQALVLFGVPKSLIANLQIQREGGKVTDYFHITMNYGNFKAIVTASMFAKGPVVKYLIKGNKGIYTKFGSDPQEALLKEGHSPLEENWGKEREEQWGKIETTEGKTTIIPTLTGSYLDYYSAIYETIRNNVSPAIKTQEALNTIKIIELAIESSKTGKTLEFK